MTSSLDLLRARQAELVAAKNERDERARLEKEIRALEEDGTLKGRAKELLGGLRQRLHDKGQQLKDRGEKVTKKAATEQGFDATTWRAPIADMSDRSDFTSAAKRATQTRHQSPLNKPRKK